MFQDDNFSYSIYIRTIGKGGGGEICTPIAFNRCTNNKA